MFIDASPICVVKVRDGQVVNRPIYVAIGVTVNGERDILGLWAGDRSEGAKFWLSVLTEIKNRGGEDVCMVVCDGLKGLPDSITTTWEYATVQALHSAPDPQHLPARTGQRPSMASKVCGRSTPPSTSRRPRPRFDEFTETWGGRYPAIITLWRSAWNEFIPFLDHNVEIRRIICSTNAIEPSTPGTGGQSRPVGTSCPGKPR